MRLKLFTIKFSENEGLFDEEEIQEFTKNKEIIDYDQHFFIHNKMPYIFVMLSYRETDKTYSYKKRRKEDPRKELDEKEKEIYDALRLWRAALAKKEGFPPYIIAMNKQLAAIIKLDPETKEDLKKVHGYGDVKIKTYGDEIIEIIRNFKKEELQKKQANKEEIKNG